MQRAKLESRILVSVCAALFLAACTGGGEAGSEADVTVFEGARVIVGDGSAPIEDAVLVVEGGRVTAVGPRTAVDIPRGATRVDLAGKTVMPAIVNAHVHLALEREERTEQLQHMAYYGAGTVLSLGHDTGDLPFAMEDEIVPDGARGLTAGRGITSSEPGRSEVPHWVTNEEDARAAVRELAAQDVELAGKTIRKGDRIRWIMAAANRDPSVFEDPDRFDIVRQPNPHLSFGSGIHYCLGVALARMEGQEVFRALAERFTRFELATEELESQPSIQFRSRNA